ncbi:MAG: hypothetical protein SO176_01760 [Bacilli bacterium]|nr:hypothetical protein [Bacilli bacterium]
MLSKNKIGYLYLPYAKSLALDFYNIYKDTGLEADDFFLSALNAIYIALDAFDVKKYDNFYPFWYEVAKHEIFHIIRENAYQYGGKAFSGVSLNGIAPENSLRLSETVGSVDENIKSISLIDEVKEIIFNPKYKFSDKEQKIISLYLQGYDLKEISRLFKTGSHNVYYTFNNIVKKVKEILDKHNIDK